MTLILKIWLLWSGDVLIIRADKDVIFDRVVQVLYIAKNAGDERLGIAVKEKPLQALKGD